MDFNNPQTKPADYQRAVAAMWTTGVTRLFPTVITGDRETMCQCLRTAAAAAELPGIGPSLTAIHVEGPWISPQDGPRGAHPKAHVRPPDRDEFERFQEAAGGRIRLLTIAPEWEGAPGMISWLVERGVTVSIGHTAATGAQIRAAVSAGARLSTHLGNGCGDFFHRHNNPIWEQLAADELSASFIVDGHHLPSATLKSMIRAKTVQRSFLVTDATGCAGCPPGRYRLGEADVELTPQGRVQLTTTDPPRMAGSALRMDDAVTNTVRLAGISWEDAFAMAGERPAALLGMSFPNDRIEVEINAEKLVVGRVIREGETLWQR